MERRAETIPPETITQLYERELRSFDAAHPASKEIHERAKGSLLSGVPMNWMTRWPGSFPVFFTEASGATVTDVDGHRYADLCLGDTGAMTGHSPPATIEAVEERLRSGITTMLPSSDSIGAGEELKRRFGLPRWQVTVSATDANRFVIRIAREITGRPKVLVFNHCYHGTVDEALVASSDGAAVPRPGSVGPPVDPSMTTRVVEFNDVDALERELAGGDVACVLTEPALTNVGIVLPDQGFHGRLRELTREHGTLLVIDETHTLCCGPGGYTAEHDLEPDLLTIGKPIAGGIPVGAYGMSEAVAERILDHTVWDAADEGGVGGTLAGNALSLAAIRATLSDVLTESAFERMIALARRFEAGVDAAIADRGLPWQVTRLGCRAEYMFAPERPRSGAEAAAAFDPALDRLMHLYMLNRGVLLTPFHMMALMSPATTEEHVDAHTAAFEEAAGELTK
ncbi:MAG TPA: aspartate aminotransferase family protein [Solirubrobacterales bacterium]|jgi:glutamate-1-semialdehyde aminotransferase